MQFEIYKSNNVPGCQLQVTVFNT